MQTEDTATAECPFDGCGWEVTVDKLYPEDDMAENDAEHQAEMHFEREHCGEAKVRVVLEKKVMLHPGNDVQSMVDRYHDRVADEEELRGFEVAFAFGEELERADSVGTSGENVDGDGDV